MIDPEKLRRRLEEVWTALGESSAADGQGVVRACALTLIVVADEDGDAAALAQTLGEVMPEHPSRTIVLRVAAGDGDHLEADVEAQCWMPFGQRQQICSEQIVIRCTHKTLGEAPAVLLPLVVADLPVVLWWASTRGWQTPSFAALAEPAGRIIFDTSRSARGAEGILALAAERARRPAPVADLAWTRLTRWRALVAQVFENERYRHELPRFSGAEIGYEDDGQAPPPATAIWMAAWLASRLGWPPDRVRFRRQPVRCAAGRLAGIELRSPDARIQISRNGPASGEVRVELAGQEAVMNRVALPLSTDALLLSEELGMETADAVFDQTLPAAVRIAEHLQP